MKLLKLLNNGNKMSLKNNKKCLVSDDTALLGKEKGFPQAGHILHNMYPYQSQPLILYADDVIRGYWYNDEAKNRIAVVPTKEVLKTWFREVHNIDVEPYLILSFTNDKQKSQEEDEKQYTYKIMVKEYNNHYQIKIISLIVMMRHLISDYKMH